MAAQTAPLLRRWTAMALVVVALALIVLPSSGEVTAATTSRRHHGGGGRHPVGVAGTNRYLYGYNWYYGRRHYRGGWTYGYHQPRRSSSGSSSSGSSSSGTRWERSGKSTPTPTPTLVPTRTPLSVPMQLAKAIKVNVGGRATGGFAADRGWTVRGWSTTRDWRSVQVYRTAGLPRSLYTSFRSAMSSSSFVYSFHVPAGTYTVRLHFVEIDRYAMSWGRRVFFVTLEGVRVLRDYDIYRDVGAYAPSIKTFTTTVSDGVLDIGFHSVARNAVVSAIEVHAAPQERDPPTPSPSASATPTRVPSASATPTQVPTASPEAVVTTPSPTSIGTKRPRVESNDLKRNLLYAKKSMDKGVVGNAARCNVQPEDCATTRTAIVDRYLVNQCLPHRKRGKLVATAATLTVALSVIGAHGCCAHELEREELLQLAMVLASTDTCIDGMSLPEGVVTTTPHNSTTVPPPSNVTVPSIDAGVTALQFLDTFDDEPAPGVVVPETVERGQLTSAASDVAGHERQQTQGHSLPGRADRVLGPSSARATVVLEFVSQPADLYVYEQHHQHMFNFNGLGCCDYACWIVADVFPFFTLEECCNGGLKALKHCK